MFSQLFVLNSRGDTLIFRDYRGDIEQTCTEIFYNKVKNKKECQTPCFVSDGVSYIFLSSSGLYFVVTTRQNVSATSTLEFLQRFIVVCKDYCGVLNEYTIQENFVLIYEILDEVLNFGYIQETSSHALKPTIQNIAVCSKLKHSLLGGPVFGLEKLSIGSESENKPLGYSGKNTEPENGELFSEILEQLLVVIDCEGNILQSEIVGSITLKCFLPHGCSLEVNLSKEFYKLHELNASGTKLEDYKCHSNVKYKEFESTGKLSVVPAVGEITLISYRMSGNISKNHLPFILDFTIQEPITCKLISVSMTIKCNIPPDKYADKLIVQFHVPKNTESVSSVGQFAEFLKSKNVVICTLAKVQGGSIISLIFKLNGTFQNSSLCQTEIDFVSLWFEIPSFVYSGGRVKSLKVFNDGKIKPTKKWTRMMTFSNSYARRLQH